MHTYWQSVIFADNTMTNVSRNTVVSVSELSGYRDPHPLSRYHNRGQKAVKVRKIVHTGF